MVHDQYWRPEGETGPHARRGDDMTEAVLGSAENPFPGASEGAVDLYVKLIRGMTTEEMTELRDRAYQICIEDGKRLVTVSHNQRSFAEMMGNVTQSRLF
jgi:hypothetical protein